MFPLQPLETLVQLDIVYMVVVPLGEQQLFLHHRARGDEAKRSGRRGRRGRTSARRDHEDIAAAATHDALFLFPVLDEIMRL